MPSGLPQHTLHDLSSEPHCGISSSNSTYDHRGKGGRSFPVFSTRRARRIFLFRLIPLAAWVNTVRSVDEPLCRQPLPPLPPPSLCERGKVHRKGWGKGKYAHAETSCYCQRKELEVLATSQDREGPDGSRARIPEGDQLAPLATSSCTDSRPRSTARLVFQQKREIKVWWRPVQLGELLQCRRSQGGGVGESGGRGGGST